LDTILRNLGVKFLVVVGGAISNCVRSTIHDAFFRDYRVIALEDCIYPSVRDKDKKIFNAELIAIKDSYAEVMKLEEFLKLIA